MKKEKDSRSFIQKPIYPGGDKALTAFIYQHLRYPQAALENKIEGTVYMEYDIDFHGKVTDVKVLQSLGYGCDEEAIRVIKMLKFDMGTYRGIKVVFHKKVRVDFRPMKQPPAPAPTQPLQTGVPQMQYVIVPTTPTAESETPVNQGNTYSYTISFG